MRLCAWVCATSPYGFSPLNNEEGPRTALQKDRIMASIKTSFSPLNNEEGPRTFADKLTGAEIVLSFSPLNNEEGPRTLAIELNLDLPKPTPSSFSPLNNEEGPRTDRKRHTYRRTSTVVSVL